MDLGLKDRVAIVGGSSRGIGRAIAMAFAQEGASVTIAARTEADLRRTELELARIGSQHHVLAIPADLYVARDIRRVVRDTVNRFGQIGILVTHVGYGPPGRPSELSDETIIFSAALPEPPQLPLLLGLELILDLDQQAEMRPLYSPRCGSVPRMWGLLPSLGCWLTEAILIGRCENAGCFSIR